MYSHRAPKLCCMFLPKILVKTLQTLPCKGENSTPWRKICVSQTSFVGYYFCRDTEPVFLAFGPQEGTHHLEPRSVQACFPSHKRGSDSQRFTRSGSCPPRETRGLCPTASRLLLHFSTAKATPGGTGSWGR